MPSIATSAADRRVAFPIVVVAVLAGLVAGHPLAARPAQPVPSSAPRAGASVPTPQSVFGFAVGTPRRLADWTQIVDYMYAVDAASPRVDVQQVGATTEGRPYLLTIVSSPDTIARLADYQAMQRRLADPRATSPAEAEAIAHDGKVVVMVGASVHATEVGASQMVSELVYRMATDDSRWMRHVLDNVILLVVPSQNPDGLQMVADWYRRNLDTPYEGSPLPELYHRYAGHDNNRDSYMLTQVETQHLTRLTYREWLPEVYLDKHQMGNGRARIFVPPFTDPANPNVDPLVWSEVNLLGQSMAAALHAAGKPGVVWGELYTGFWQGANSTTPWWHNMVALLTEVASADLATTVVQEHPESSGATAAGRTRHGFGRDTGTSIPAPGDLSARMRYPEPWRGGAWSLSDVVEYQLIATLGLLEGAANNKATLKRNFYRMNRRTIERYAAGDPFAFIVPAAQRDPLAATRLLQLLQAGGAEVHRARAPFRADAVSHEAGTHVIRLDQPFGRWVKDLLEPQRYPEARTTGSTWSSGRPYDVTAWSLGLLMGVDVRQVDRPFEASLTRLDDEAAAPAGRLVGRGGVFVLDHRVNASFVATNRLLAEGARVGWAREPIETNGLSHPPGAVVVQETTRERMRALAAELSIRIDAVPAVTSVVDPIVLPRIAVYEPWGGNMDAGWTRWVLEQHEFPFAHVRNADMRRPELARRHDVIVIPEMTPSQVLRGLQARNVRPEYRGGIGETGVRNLHAFLEAGGTIVTLGNAARFAIEALDAPAVNVVRGLDDDVFFCPGSILAVDVDTSHPIGYGMPDAADAMFVDNGGYRAVPGAGDAVEVVASFPSRPLLRSGLIVGERRLRGSGAVLVAAMGRGRVIMHGVRVQHRGQTWGTFRLLLNSLFYGPSATRRMHHTLDAAEVQP